MDDFVAKPIQPNELYQVLSRVKPLPVAPALPADPPAPTEGAGDVLDVAGFRNRCGGRDELVRQIVRLFLSECPRHISALRSAFDRADASALRIAAHTLKGTVGNLSASAAYQAARKLEDLGRAGRLDTAGAALRDLEVELDRLRPALRVLLADPAPSGSARDMQISSETI
jgi:HPt (histidine-containing phosphotransfer) domain-containing protein